MEQFLKENIKHSSEICSLEDEFEKQKRKLVEQIRCLENELEINYEETQDIFIDKIFLENKISNFDEFECEEKIEKLKLDLKRSTILLKDATKQLSLGNDHFRNRKMINQMKYQIEEVENERNSAIKMKKNLEEELFEMQDKLDEVTQIKIITDEKYFETSRIKCFFVCIGRRL